MTLVIIFGPPAVGKMTVGLELARLTGFRLFHFVWALGDPDDRRLVDDAVQTFAKHGAPTCFVELTATHDERLRRNETPLRLQEKLLQRDVAGSRQFLLDADERYQLNTRDSFYYPERYLKIDNTALEPTVVAEQIVDHFGLQQTR